MADLIQRLLNEAHDFNFFQAVSLLEEYYHSKGTRNSLESGRIRFFADPSIAFPPNDIAGIKKSKEGISFLLSFMGLIGVSSPLPIYFSEYVSRRPEDAKGLFDFLTIFNHRMYSLFYKAWKKYHFMRCFTESENDPFTRQVASIAGLNNNELTPQRLRLLAYCGILAGSSRSGSGLSALLSDFFDGIAVKVHEFCPRWAQIRDVKTLGADISLGKNAILGTSFYDITEKFRVVLGPLKREVYETFLPGSSRIGAMKQLIATYLADPLEYDIEVQLQSIDLIPVALGEDNARLGETAALGRSEGKTDIQSIIISG